MFENEISLSENLLQLIKNEKLWVVENNTARQMQREREKVIMIVQGG